MKLLELIHEIELKASSQPSIGMIVRNDIFRLNSAPQARYGVFAWTQGTHSLNIDAGTNDYTFILYYVDRLVSDASNEAEVQSVGIQTLTNILKGLEDDGVFSGTAPITPFNQRFSDQCAGVFATVTFSVPAEGGCAESFADFNEDFNEDFLIY